jgi:6-phosphogluconolactonase
MSDNSPFMEPVLQIFPDGKTLSAALAARVAAAAAEAVAARGRFLLAIPGGSVVSILAGGLVNAAVDASAWHVFWTDERCVPLSDPQSNFHLAETELLPRLAGARVHPIRGSARDYEDELRPFLPLDLVLLGLGEDGHVASLFPGHSALLETKRAVAAVANAPKPPPERVTLTLSVLNRARHILVVAAGMGKADVLARVLAPEGGSAQLPAQLLCPSHGDLRWMLDRAAAANLPAALLTPPPNAEEHP